MARFACGVLGDPFLARSPILSERLFIISSIDVTIRFDTYPQNEHSNYRFMYTGNYRSTLETLVVTGHSAC